ncbi:MAG: hypothetical protein PQJ61_00230 [Spirochaetales bacterium]|uniref:Lipoprotein n=1 Tax=Candidatus Thalassospirochaeta sargassi TaxID=3119039 RepID=A0AAJ1MM46_9SPIO|nr:hypothetical protein [Spirochaetales bacterium]
MIKNTFVRSLLLAGIIIALLAGCAGTQGAVEKNVDTVQVLQPKTGSYSGYGWGIVELAKSGNCYTGTYTDTWASGKGTIELRYKDGSWEGSWREPAIDREGTLYDIKISQDGERITGLHDVTKDGGKGSFADLEFIWEFDS